MYIGLTQRVDVISSRNEIRDALDQALINWVITAGHLPIPIPNTLPLNSVSKWLNSVGVEALLLSGGNNIGDFPSRDNLEKALLKWSIDYKKPTLGICRGMQAMALFDGGQLMPVKGHVKNHHKIHGDINCKVNSYHDYAVHSLPPGWRCLATSEDTVIEAMQHDNRPWEAWMWHPERSARIDLEFITRFNLLLKRGYEL